MGNHSGHITVSAEEHKDSGMIVQFQVDGRGLDKKDMFGASDPFLKISRKKQQGDGFEPVHKVSHLLFF